MRSVAGEADIEVRGGRTGFPDGALPQVARLPGVRTVSPALELDAGLAGTERTLRVIGLDILRAAVAAAGARRRGALRAALAGQGLSPPARPPRWGSAKATGCASSSAAHGGARDRRRAARFGAARPGRTGRHRQRAMALRRLGELNRLDVRLGKARPRCVVKDIQALLPPGVHAAPSKARAGERLSVALVSREPERAGDGGAPHRRLPRVLGAGARDARRRGEHALLRVLGLEARDRAPRARRGGGARRCSARCSASCSASVRACRVRLTGRDLGAGKFRDVVRRGPPLAARRARLFPAGIAIAVFGALLPARDAARTPPARALQARATSRRCSTARLGLARPRAISPAPRSRSSVRCTACRFSATPPSPACSSGDRAHAARAHARCSACCRCLASPQLALALGAAAGRARAGGGEPGGDRRELLADGGDGDHGRVVPPVGGRLARHGAACGLYFRTTHAGDTGVLEPAFVERVRALPQVARLDFLRAAA